VAKSADALSGSLQWGFLKPADSLNIKREEMSVFITEAIKQLGALISK
jgi:hypothetical protein